jgi:Tol biopolymer transport system component
MRYLGLFLTGLVGLTIITALLLTGSSAASLSGATTRVSVDSAGNQGTSMSRRPSISADGRYVAFESTAPNLVAEGTSGNSHIFVHDRQTGTTELVSVNSSGEQANGSSTQAAISADGRHVAFKSSSTNLSPGDTNGKSDVFVRDLDTGITENVHVSSDGVLANDRVFYWSDNYQFRHEIAISEHGRYVAFASWADNLVPGDTNNQPDVFVHDRQTGVTERVSVDSDGNEANDKNYGLAMTPDGRFVAFNSKATNLVPDEAISGLNILVHDRQTGVTELVSIDPLDGGPMTAWTPSISADGRFVAFLASGCDVHGWCGFYDVYVRDRQTGTTERVSRGWRTYPDLLSRGEPDSLPSISGDGRFVAFTSGEALVEGDDNGKRDVFVRDRPAQAHLRGGGEGRWLTALRACA